MERILQSYVSGTRVILVMTWSNWISKYLNSNSAYNMQVIKHIYTTPSKKRQISIGKSLKQRQD